MVEFGEALATGRERQRERNIENRDKKRGWEAKNRPPKATKPFAGFDGEGWNDKKNHHQLWILRAGEHELYTGKPLDVFEIFKWLVELPRDVNYVGFALGYDWGMILKAMPRERFLRLHNRKARTFPNEKGQDTIRPVDWDRFRIDWIPGKRFSVWLAEDTRRRFDVEDTIGCFQQPFAVAIDHWLNKDDITKGEQQFIERMKQHRKDFRELAKTPEGLAEIREYNHLECILLARMMERVRDACNAQKINPSSWFGSGQLAQAMLRKHRAGDHFGKFDSAFMARADGAYFGGFFDVSEVGIFPGVYEYDINSAYPHVMRGLPCLSHAKLVHGDYPGRRLYRVKWRPIEGAAPTWGPFPVRHFRGERRADGTERNPFEFQHFDTFTPGTLYYPLMGDGWYWDVEVLAVMARGEYMVDVVDSWTIQRECDCEPFQWIPELYDYRKKLGKSGQGMVLKLGLNSLYGKLAQRVGQPRYANPCYAGMVTAGTRAMLHDAIRLAGPDNVVMVATDAVYAKRPIEGLQLGAGLGEWEAKEFGEYMVILPGLHYAMDASRLKTRSIPVRIIREALKRIRSHWYSDKRWEPIHFRMEAFISNQLALRVGRPERRGEWLEIPRSIRFGSPDKRRIPTAEVTADSAKLPLWENPERLRSGSRAQFDHYLEVERLRERETGIPALRSLDDQPDYFDPLAIWGESV